ncbi:hypothetical protein FIBSPDRAFT_846767 [Athelia psychrophila]|uniref:Uncharacterized protein n=1 Tax=Athelia psychrophila TaxID=1759441 RepID=A0A166XCS8_9AGAM|nr:hypothetical protein FIBSPDRAFT_846767 [Fibularhizoctonia sp. CBS 109695]
MEAQVQRADLGKLVSTFVGAGFPPTAIHDIGTANLDQADQTIPVMRGLSAIFAGCASGAVACADGEVVSMQTLCDNPAAAKEEFDLVVDETSSGLV